MWMNDAFEERKKKYEEKWAHDEAMRFKVVARRNKLLGQWAAGELGLQGAKAEEYANAVVAAEFHKAGVDNVFHKIRSDFEAAKLAHSEQAIRRKMEQLLAAAGDQIMHEGKR
jgi:hypothetical protein